MRVLLFPGSFSPFTDGHYILIHRYILYAMNHDIDIDKILILMSSTVRDGIDPKIIYQFVSQVYSNNNKIEVKLSDKSGPIRECYEIVGNTENIGNTYVFMRSDKDNDKVADSFYKEFSKGGKYYVDGISVEKFDVDLKPELYYHRKDKYNKTPISASIAREDLKNKDFESFKQNYIHIMNNETSIEEKHIKKLFDILCKTK